MFACQFVAGLNPTLKSKLARVESTFSQLLVKTRFEEAKARDLPLVTMAFNKTQSKETHRSDMCNVL